MPPKISRCSPKLCRGVRFHLSVSDEKVEVRDTAELRLLATLGNDTGISYLGSLSWPPLDDKTCVRGQTSEERWGSSPARNRTIAAPSGQPKQLVSSIDLSARCTCLAVAAADPFPLVG